MSDQPILYLGDTSLETSACYLAGLMTAFGLGFEYVRSDQALPVETASRPRKLFILSDYPAKMMSDAAAEQLLTRVRDDGAGLLMIGGWESFHGVGGGFGGNWDGSPIGKALPIEISTADDRVNCDQPALLLRAQEHEIVANLPWEARPPTIGGFNRVITKSKTATILLVQQFAAAMENGRIAFTPRDQHPLLVLGSHGAGLTAALMTDLAPHWVGGLVDWGDARVRATAAGSSEIEVGNFYAQFVANLLMWTGQLQAS
jgi:hypothetical protein